MNRLTSGWKGRRRILSSAFTLPLVWGVLSAVPAGAATAACGQFISSSTTLDGDIGPCRRKLHREQPRGRRLARLWGAGNVVARNQIVRNGEQGVVGQGFAGSNQVLSNLVAFNGFRGSEAGDGIDFAPVPFPVSQNLVRGNTVMFNAGDGIHVAEGGNEVVASRTAGNGSLRPSAFDLLDSSSDNACDQNRWSSNTFATAFPACTTAP